jgi:hypothetical protein
MVQQTAVEWFYIKIHEMYNGNTDLHFDLLLEQANEMFKQQIEAAWKRGDGEHDKVADELSKKYYTETYGNKTKNS